MPLEDLFHKLIDDSGVGRKRISHSRKFPYSYRATIPVGPVWQRLSMDCKLRYDKYLAHPFDGTEDLTIMLSHSTAYLSAQPRVRFKHYEMELYFRTLEEAYGEKRFVLETFSPQNKEMRALAQSLLEGSHFDMLYRTLGREVPLEYRDLVSEDAAKILLYTLVGVGQQVAQAPELVVC